MKRKKLIYSIFYEITGVTLSYTGAATCAFAAIGQGPVGAFQYSLSIMIGVKMGIIAFLFQSIFIAGQWLLERKKFRLYQLLQLPICAYGSFVLNFMLYDILGDLLGRMPYALCLLLLLVGIFINASGIKIILWADLVRIPLEGFLILLAQKRKKTLGYYKKNIDIIFLICALLICIISKQEICVREGTVINALLFGTLLDWLSRFEKRYTLNIENIK